MKHTRHITLGIKAPRIKAHPTLEMTSVGYVVFIGDVCVCVCVCVDGPVGDPGRH